MSRPVHYQLLLLQRISVVMMLLMVAVTGHGESGLGRPLSPVADPGFSLEDMQGELHTSSDYAGKTVIVNFWAVWCAPCRREIPAMNRAMHMLKKENIAMLAVNVGDTRSAIEKFSKANPMDFTVLLDKDGAVSQRWQVMGFPTTYIINAHGKVIYRVVGGREWDEDSVLASLRSIAVGNESAVNKDNLNIFEEVL